MRKSLHIPLPITAVKTILDGGNGCVGASVMLWFDPFALEYSPERFGNVEMWGVRRQIHYVGIVIVPFGYFSLNFFAFVRLASLHTPGYYGVDYASLYTFSQRCTVIGMHSGTSPMRLLGLPSDFSNMPWHLRLNWCVSPYIMLLVKSNHCTSVNSILQAYFIVCIWFFCSIYRLKTERKD